MAEVSFLHFPEDDHDFFVEHEHELLLDEFSTLDSFPCFTDSLSSSRHGGTHAGLEFFAPSSSRRTAGSSTGSDFGDGVVGDRKNQVNFVMDLFHQQVELSHIMGCDEFVSLDVNDMNFGVIEENYDVSVDDLDLELRLGLGLEDDGDGDADADAEDDCNCSGFIVSECGDEFYVARRESGSENENEILSGSPRADGLVMARIESDSEEEENELWRVHVHSEEEEFEVDDVNVDDLSIPLCWDSFQLEEDDDHGGVTADFEWEEVDDGGVDDGLDGEVLSVAADHDGSRSVSVWAYSGPEEDRVEERETERQRGRGLRNLEWQVLLDVNHMGGRNPETIGNDNDPVLGLGAYLNDHDDFFNAAEYEMMFGQFAESENAFLTRPPASKYVVENLPSVITTKEDMVNEKALCAVCKDQIEVGEEGKKLPCSHRYHGDCIIPWLRIRNTCPLCRFELPTDDADYEQRRGQRVARVP
ncbi:hypothetical protein SOVF_049200 [Spinacia oleracea]|uniref:RING-type E3 ubiquitin transferase n=1 Tax=Spinacia oleracea TaxID=3562 RepID=A0A9R0ITX9_SPIOL|nr:E3 ubiquitin ligase BIG BROTHER-related [Spinacia oleracea]KNA20777.1 hypothetical protein SOVF_049200 [Spinacia oleracea]